MIPMLLASITERTDLPFAEMREILQVVKRKFCYGYVQFEISISQPRRDLNRQWVQRSEVQGCCACIWESSVP